MFAVITLKSGSTVRLYDVCQLGAYVEGNTSIPNPESRMIHADDYTSITCHADPIPTEVDTSEWLEWERPTQGHRYEVVFSNPDGETVSHVFDSFELKLATQIASEIATDARCTCLSFVRYSHLQGE